MKSKPIYYLRRNRDTVADQTIKPLQPDYKVMKSNLLLVVLLPALSLDAQPFQIGHTTITFTDSSRNNRNIATEIYYPADAMGNNVPVTVANAGPFPVLSFGHGFVMTWEAYRNIWEAVVPEGFIIAFPKTEGSLSPSHGEFAKDLAFVIPACTALGEEEASLLYQRVDSMNGVLGHSMGGGAAFLAAQWSPAVKTLVTFAAAETNPSAMQAAASVSIPALVFAGGNDCVTPPPAHQIPMYSALQSSCKTYVSINGGSHCQMANNNLLCNFGEATCTPPPGITRAEQQLAINRYLIPWLKKELKGDCLAGAQFDSTITTDSSIVFERTCLLCNPTIVQEYATNTGLAVFPNPFHDQIFVQGNHLQNRMVAIDLYAMDGRKICAQTFFPVAANAQLVLNFKIPLPAGIYLLHVMADGERTVRKLVRQ